MPVPISPPPITTTSCTTVDRLRDITLENITAPGWFLMAGRESVYNAGHNSGLQTTLDTTGYRLAGDSLATYSQYTVLSNLYQLQSYSIYYLVL